MRVSCRPQNKRNQNPGLVTFDQNNFQPPAFPSGTNTVVYDTALTTHIIAISSDTACDSCRRNLDAYFTCVWLGGHASPAARDRTGAGRMEAAHAIHAAMQPLNRR